MKSLLSPQTDALDHYSSRRHLRRNEVSPVDHRWSAVLSLHLAGHSVTEISELSGYAVPTIYHILSDPKVREVRQQLLSHLDDEFEAQYRDVLDVVKAKLLSQDEKVQLQAVEIWMKANGKYKALGAGQTSVTAENVVMQIMQQGASTQVNQGGGAS